MKASRKRNRPTRVDRVRANVWRSRRLDRYSRLLDRRKRRLIQWKGGILNLTYESLIRLLNLWIKNESVEKTKQANTNR